MSQPNPIRWKRGAVEFVVIFAGVSLSLLADEWRDERRESHERVAVFEQLSADLSEEMAEHAFVAARATGLRDSSQRLLDAWDGPGPGADSLAVVLGAFGCPLIFEYRSPAYAGLQSASGLPLISGTELGRRVIEYFEVRQVEAENFAESLAASRGRLVEALYPFVEFAPCLPESPSASAPLHVSWEALSRDLELRNRLVEVVTLSALTSEWVGRAAAAAEALVREIDGAAR